MTATSYRLSSIRLQIIAICLGIFGFISYAFSKFTTGNLVVVLTAAGFLGFIACLVILAIRQKRFLSILKTIGLSLLAVILGGYLLLTLLIFFFQDAIANQTSAFFQPQRITEGAAQALASETVEILDLTAQDGTHLRGWLAKNSQEAVTPLLIYFDGSGSESSKMLPYVQSLDGWSVALVNYRGFGQSEGTPSHAKVLSDALFIFETLSKRPDIDPKRIVSMGYSLGTGVAVYLSEQRPTAATVLAAPYDHLTLAGQNPTGIYAPLSGILHTYFDSITRAPGIQSPLLALVGSDDPVFPPPVTRALVDQWGGETTLKEYPGEDHNLLLNNNSSWDDIQKFLDSIQ